MFFGQIAAALKGYTGKCVISFVDVYVKKIADITKKNGMAIGSCAESIDLDACGIVHNCCIEFDLKKNITEENCLERKGLA